MSKGFTTEELAEIQRLLPDECANDGHFENGKVVPDKGSDNMVHIYARHYTVEIVKINDWFAVSFKMMGGNFKERPLNDAIQIAKERFLTRVNKIHEEAK